MFFKGIPSPEDLRIPKEYSIPLRVIENSADLVSAVAEMSPNGVRPDVTSTPLLKSERGDEPQYLLLLG